MAGQRANRIVEIEHEDRVVASAHVTKTPEEPDKARAAVHVEAGHLPVGARSRLVDEVLNCPEVQESTELTATVPLGDSETLLRLQERAPRVQPRPAGCTAVVDVKLHAD